MLFQSIAGVLISVLVLSDARRHWRREINTCKEDNLERVDYSLDDVEGVWYKILHKYRSSSTSNKKTSFTVKLEKDGNKLGMAKYWIEDDVCKGPKIGEWTKSGSGKIRIKSGEWDKELNVLYHYKNDRYPQEQTIALYACLKAESDGTCNEENQMAAVISKSRRPSAEGLFYAAKALEKACVNPRTLQKMNTLTTCGDVLLENEDKFSEESQPEPESEAEPVDKCNPDNIEGIEINLSREGASESSPKTHYMIGSMNVGQKKGITMMNSVYSGEKEGNKYKVQTKFVKHGVCYKGTATEFVDPEDSTVWITQYSIRTPAGPREMTKKHRLIWERNGVFLFYMCAKKDPMEATKCIEPQSFIISNRPWVRLGDVAQINQKLRSICLRPRKMVYMHTTARCPTPIDITTHVHTHKEKTEAQKCKADHIQAASHFTIDRLEGTWYMAAGIGTASIHSNFKSAVFNRTRTSDPNVLKTVGYANLNDGSCIKMEGTVKLISPLNAVIQLDVKGMIGGEEKRIQSKNKVLHAGAQMIVFYWCGEQNEDGTCKAPYVRIDSKTREIKHTDVLNVKQHVKDTCVDLDSVSWFWMHSQCGKELDLPFRLHHGHLALTHTDTMDIITKFSTPMCNFSDVKGQDICLKKLAENGPWYPVAMYDAKWNEFTFYGGVSVIHYTGNGSATSMEQAVFNAGDGKTCHKLKWNMYKEKIIDPKDVTFSSKFTFWGTDYHVHFKWVWSNYKISVGYWCHKPNRDGTCPTNKQSVYIMANHESIDHAEWLLIEQIVKSLCVDPAILKHSTALEFCVIDQAQKGNTLYPPFKNCDWEQFKGLPINPDQVDGTYHTVAFASKTALGQGMKARSYKLEKVDNDKIKLVTKAQFAGSDSCEDKELILTRGEAETNEWTTSIDLDGNSVKVSIWLGHMAGPYSVTIGCTGEDCNAETGFVFIDSEYRANDKIAMQQVYEYLQEKCIDYRWLTLLDTHSECNSAMDSNTCKFSEVQPLASYDVTGFGGIWYLAVHSNRNYASMKCKAEPGEATDNQVKMTCYSKLGERCMGPSEGKYVRKDQSKPGEIQYVFPIGGGRNKKADFKLLHIDENYVVMIGCQKLSGDGSCLASRTSAMIWAKTPTVSESQIPEAVLDKLDDACFSKENLIYLESTDCGNELE